MYYRFFNNDDDSYDLIKNCNHIATFLKYSKEYDDFEIIYPYVDTIKPETMKQHGRRYQSFYLKTVSGKELSLFNFSHFRHLSKIFSNPKVLVYKDIRGYEERDKIIGYIDQNEVEHYF